SKVGLKVWFLGPGPSRVQESRHRIIGPRGHIYPRSQDLDHCQYLMPVSIFVTHVPFSKFGFRIKGEVKFKVPPAISLSLVRFHVPPRLRPCAVPCLGLSFSSGSDSLDSKSSPSSKPGNFRFGSNFESTFGFGPGFLACVCGVLVRVVLQCYCGGLLGVEDRPSFLFSVFTACPDPDSNGCVLGVENAAWGHSVRGFRFIEFELGPCLKSLRLGIPFESVESDSAR
uniref:Uncharacterized protein n=1 Tax=Cannabis sativa TaxID=3483 RepID=A0A803QRK5_CANSA